MGGRGVSWATCEADCGSQDLQLELQLLFPPRVSSHASNVSAPASQLHLVSSPARERGSAGARCAPGRLEKRSITPRREQQVPAPAPLADGDETQPHFTAAALPAPAGTGHIPTVPGAILMGSGLCLPPLRFTGWSEHHQDARSFLMGRLLAIL